ncbi:MAG: type IX secretion system sortase PorU [Candidatus Marinimicrobia bacterium]|nr:type IX secretion system sortase PorU [Candidatus Neomarinimicrobiota bacterium]
MKVLIISCLLTYLLHSEIKVLDEKPKSIRVQYTTQNNLKFKGLENYPGEPIRISLSGDNSEYFTPELYLPVYNELIALPDTIKPTIDILDIKYEEQQLPGQIPAKVRSQLENIKQVSFSKPGYARLTPAATMKIIPLNFNQGSGNIKIIRSMTIKINLRSNRQLSSSDRNQRDVLKTGFLNKKYIDQYYQPIQHKLTKETIYPSGKWLRIGITHNGIYKVGFGTFQDKLDLENSISSDRLVLYSNKNSGRKLSSDLPADISDNIIENNIKILDGNDGKFNNGDTILFYGQSTSGFDLNSSVDFTYNKNPYSEINYYWLLIADEEIESPARMAALEGDQYSPDYTQTTTEIAYRYENDLHNYLQSGDEWFGKKFENKGDSKRISGAFDNINLSDNEALDSNRKPRAKIRVAGGKDGSKHRFNIYLNNNYIASDRVSNYSRLTFNFNNDDIGNLIEADKRYLFRIEYNTSNSEAYFDYLELLYHNNLVYDGEPFILSGDKFTGNIKYQISNKSSSDLIVYNISDLKDVSTQSYTSEGNHSVFTAQNDSLNRQQYYICTSLDYKEPETIDYVEDCSWNSLRNGNISADYIIITNNKFQEAAQQIASVHEDKVPSEDRLETIITTQKQILREFNGDVKDPNAIRHFVKYAFQNWSTIPGYILLLGDGTYDHRGIEVEFTGNNIIMTYQDIGVPGEYYYFPNDAFYTYVSGDDRFMDLAIGRLPVRTEQQALNTAHKIEKYLVEPQYGEWRNQITLVADDSNRPYDNETEHIRHSENRLAPNIPLNFNISKLYALEFPAEENASSYGVGRPAATSAIIEQLNKGTSIITYLGHGSPDHWAQEGLLETNDLGKINTGAKLPIWLVGTCSWSYYDFVDKMCMPEKLIIAKNSGAIATFGGPRPSYATSNSSLLRKILQEWFHSDQINRARIGDIIRIIKHGNSHNDEQYTLFGDPALFPAFPYYKSNFDKLKDDTLESLERVKVSGDIHQDLTNFSGHGILKVFDSEEKVKRQDIEGGDSLTYILPGNKIFHGQLKIENGKFATNFIVPKDVSYGDRPGYFNIYAWNAENGKEVSGYYKDIYYSGSKEVNDTTGPKIDIGFTDIEFKNDDIVTPENDLFIRLADKNGINIANQLGHELILKFDEENQKYNVTEHFKSTSDTTGEILYSIPEELESGRHKVTIQAWDNANNLNISTAEFNFSPSSTLQLERVVNYPNPFSTSTDFTFHLTRDARIQIKIYTIRGLLIREINPGTTFPAGFNTIYWDGKDDFGDKISRGIYLYKISAEAQITEENESYIGKMVKE